MKMTVELKEIREHNTDKATYPTNKNFYRTAVVNGEESIIADLVILTGGRQWDHKDEWVKNKLIQNSKKAALWLGDNVSVRDYEDNGADYTLDCFMHIGYSDLHNNTWSNHGVPAELLDSMNQSVESVITDKGWTRKELGLFPLADQKLHSASFMDRRDLDGFKHGDWIKSPISIGDKPLWLKVQLVKTPVVI